jgi:hypothetical protein
MKIHQCWQTWSTQLKPYVELLRLIWILSPPHFLLWFIEQKTYNNFKFRNFKHISKIKLPYYTIGFLKLCYFMHIIHKFSFKTTKRICVLSIVYITKVGVCKSFPMTWRKVPITSITFSFHNCVTYVLQLMNIMTFHKEGDYFPKRYVFMCFTLF